MFATVRRYQGKPGHFEETVRRVQQGLIPILSQQPGFVSYYAVDGGNDVAASVSIYQSRAAADAANAEAASWVKSHLTELVGPAEVTVGEVRASATASPEAQNVQLVRQAYDAFGRGDIPGLLALLDDKIEWLTPGPADLPTAGARRGHAAVAEFFQTLSAVIEMQQFAPKDFIAQGDRVVVVGEDVARVKATGKSLEFQWTHVFTVRNGRIAVFQEFGDVTALVAETRSAHARV